MRVTRSKNRQLLALNSLLVSFLMGSVASAQPAPEVAPEPPEEPAAEPAPPAEAADEAAAPEPEPEPEPAPEPAPAATETRDAEPAMVEPEATSEDASVEAEALAIEQSLLQGDESGESEESGIDLYGFTDFTYIREYGETEPFPGRFAIGNFNLYIASDLGDDWRTLSEVRFTYLPHGATQFGETGPEPRINQAVPDYNNVDRPVRVGGLIIERAWLEYSAHPLLNVRMGHWLTPYGIWNVDHGSPVIIGVRQPFIIGDQLFPTSQTGLQLHGIQHLSSAQLGYNLTMSNGRGPLDTHMDLDKNKGLGARLFARLDTGVGSFTLGVSGYRGTYTDATDEVLLVPPDSFEWRLTRTAHYEEEALAADLQWNWGGLALQVEAIQQNTTYPDDEFRPVVFAFDPPQGYVPDGSRKGGYAQVGYRFDFGGIMPYTGIEYYEDDFVFGSSREAWWGLNIRPTPRVVLKGQYTYAWFPDQDFGVESYKAIQFQSAWSF